MINLPPNNENVPDPQGGGEVDPLDEALSDLYEVWRELEQFADSETVHKVSATVPLPHTNRSLENSFVVDCVAVDVPDRSKVHGTTPQRQLTMTAKIDGVELKKGPGIAQMTDPEEAQFNRALEAAKQECTLAQGDWLAIADAFAGLDRPDQVDKAVDTLLETATDDTFKAHTVRRFYMRDKKFANGATVDGSWTDDFPAGEAKLTVIPASRKGFRYTQTAEGQASLEEIEGQSFDEEKASRRPENAEDDLFNRMLELSAVAFQDDEDTLPTEENVGELTTLLREAVTRGLEKPPVDTALGPVALGSIYEDFMHELRERQGKGDDGDQDDPRP